MKKIADKPEKTYSVILETAEPGSGDLVKYLKKNKITTAMCEKSDSSHSGFDEIEYRSASRKVLKAMMNKFWHSPELAESIFVS